MKACMCLVLAALLSVIPASAAAATPADLISCRSVVEDAARLTCYDDLADGLGTLPLRAPPAIAASMRAPVAKALRDPYGKLVIELADGARWAQVDSGRLSVEPGDEVRIEPAASGSFLLEKSTGSRKIRVRRLP